MNDQDFMKILGCARLLKIPQDVIDEFISEHNILSQESAKLAHHQEALAREREEHQRAAEDNARKLTLVHNRVTELENLLQAEREKDADIASLTRQLAEAQGKLSHALEIQAEGVQAKNDLRAARNSHKQEIENLTQDNNRLRRENYLIRQDRERS